MSLTIDVVGTDQLAEYASVPMICNVESIFDVHENKIAAGPIDLRERPMAAPYLKDYDACPDGGPLDWGRQFDLSTWRFWLARDHGEIVGAAAVAWNTPSCRMLEGRTDVAALWDIRVSSTSMRQGVGTALFRKAASWATSEGCRTMIVETQNVNVAACRFYEAMGCKLHRLDRLAYRDHVEIANEIMLLWQLPLNP